MVDQEGITNYNKSIDDASAYSGKRKTSQSGFMFAHNFHLLDHWKARWEAYFKKNSPSGATTIYQAYSAAWESLEDKTMKIKEQGNLPVETMQKQGPP